MMKNITKYVHILFGYSISVVYNLTWRYDATWDILKQLNMKSSKLVKMSMSMIEIQDDKSQHMKTLDK